MINRDLIRIKVVQLVYAYSQNGESDITKADKELTLSLSKSYQLYNNLLLLICAVTKMARKRYDIINTKAEREGRVIPQNAFIDNKFALQLEDNTQLRSFVETNGDIWEQKAEFVKNLLLEMQEDETVKCDIGSSYEDCKAMWKHLYKTHIQDNESLSDILESESLYWNGDKGIIDTFVLKTISRFDEGAGSEQELLPEYKENDDEEYAHQLLYTALKNAEEYQQYIKEACKAWDFSRLAKMDIVIMQLAIAEMINFPKIPIPVTINEYVELANEYSTPKSGKFINGILDSIAKEKNLKIKKIL
jgi:N utilization substance protein B